MSTDESDLVFTNIKRSEAGEYMCEASNECGNASQTARIFVQCKLTITCHCNLCVLIISVFICNVFYELEQQQKSFINETNPTLTA